MPPRIPDIQQALHLAAQGSPPGRPPGPKTLQCRQTIGLLLIFRHRMLKMTNPPTLLRLKNYEFAFCRGEMLGCKNDQHSDGFAT